MKRDITYTEAKSLAVNLRAVGETEIYLWSHDDAPWHLVTSVEPGGSHRLDMATSVWFRAHDDSCGLSFRWTFEIESRDADGKGHYEIDVPACRSVLKKLNGDARKSFRDYLSDCATKVQAKADEWRKMVTRQDTDAQLLRQLATK